MKTFLIDIQGMASWESVEDTFQKLCSEIAKDPNIDLKDGDTVKFIITNKGHIRTGSHIGKITGKYKKMVSTNTVNAKL